MGKNWGRIQKALGGTILDHDLKAGEGGTVLDHDLKQGKGGLSLTMI